MYTEEEIKKVAVYCASSSRLRDCFYEDAYRVGELLAEAGKEVIYGAGHMGLMGKMADGVLARGGKLTGVIPQFMIDQGWHNRKCSDMVVTKDMADRKTWIWQHSDALLALPGGIGTLDELSEVLVLKQLGIVTQPIVLLNTEGFYEPFVKMIEKMIEEQFMLDFHRDMFSVVNKPEHIIPAIMESAKWSKDSLKKAKF